MLRVVPPAALGEQSLQKFFNGLLAMKADLIGQQWF
jgi:hypothetical protein